MSQSAQSLTEEQILKTLKSIQQTAAETDRVSAATAEIVAAQGEQIDNIAHNAETIEDNLNTSERLIRGLKGWGGRIANALSGVTASSSTSQYPSYMPSNAVRTDPTPAQIQTKSSATSFSQPPRSDFDQQVDEQLDQISHVLGGIHARSRELSDSISKQVKQVEAVDRSVDRNNERIRKQHDQIQRLR